MEHGELQKRYADSQKREAALSKALCDMLFVFTCFEEHGMDFYPESMQEKLREYHHQAREVFIHHKACGQ